MKNANSRGRPRNRNIPGKRVPNRNQVFESNGPGVRVRGNAQQLVEKYLAMARDAASQGDRILAENCHQHADHYQRVLNALAGRYVKADENGANAAPALDDDDALPNQLDESRAEGSDGEATVLPGPGADTEPSTVERRERQERRDQVVDMSASADRSPDESAPNGADEAEAEAPAKPKPERRRGRPPKAAKAAAPSPEAMDSPSEESLSASA